MQNKGEALSTKPLLTTYLIELPYPCEAGVKSFQVHSECKTKHVRGCLCIESGIFKMIIEKKKRKWDF